MNSSEIFLLAHEDNDGEGLDYIEFDFGYFATREEAEAKAAVENADTIRKFELEREKFFEQFTAEWEEARKDEAGFQNSAPEPDPPQFPNLLFPCAVRRGR